MARLARVELFAAAEIAVVHVMNRVVRWCFLRGDDAVTGKNDDHRKHWIEDKPQKLAGALGIDLLGTVQASDHTSAQRRIEAERARAGTPRDEQGRSLDHRTPLGVQRGLTVAPVRD